MAKEKSEISQLRGELESFKNEVLNILKNTSNQVGDLSTMLTMTCTKLDMFIVNFDQMNTQAKKTPKKKQEDEISVNELTIETGSVEEKKTSVKTYHNISTCFNGIYAENPTFFDRWLTEDIKAKLEEEKKPKDSKIRQKIYYEYMKDNHKDILDKLKQGFTV